MRWLCVILSWGLAAAVAKTAPVPSPNPVDLGRGAWGRLEHIEGQHWLMVVTRFSSNRTSYLEVLRSDDACRHWTPLTQISETGRKLDNGHLLRLPDGTLLLTGRSLVDGQSYRLPVYTSTNSGHTWRRVGNIDSIEGVAAAEKKGLWEPFLSLLPDGRVSAIYSSEKHPGFSQVLSQKISSDGGVTWSAEHRIVEEPGGGKLRPGMGVVTRLRDGRFFLVYEVVGLGRGLVHYKISPDGRRWPEGLGTPIEGHEAAPYVLTLRDGRLLLTSCGNQLLLSDDQGKTWYSANTESWPVTFRYTWPALYEIAPGELAAARSEGAVRLRWFTVPPPPK